MVDALDLTGVEVQARCLGTITGAAVAILAVADRRTAGPHATVHLREPRPPHDITGRELETLADRHERQVRRLQNRIAQACRRPIEAVAADMRAHRVLTDEQAREYGLIDSFGSQTPRAGSCGATRRMRTTASFNVMVCLGYEAAPPAMPAGRGVHGVVVVVTLS